MGIFGGGRVLRAVINSWRFIRDETAIGQALLHPGAYQPQVTRTDAATGKEVVVRDEVVIPRGQLRDGTVRLAIMGVFGSWVVLKGYLANGLTAAELADEIFWGAAATLATSVGTIWTHIRSWLPVRGAKAPVSTPPPPPSA